MRFADAGSGEVCLARVDCQRGDFNLEYAAVVGRLPREVTVLQKQTDCQRWLAKVRRDTGLLYVGRIGGFF